MHNSHINRKWKRASPGGKEEKAEAGKGGKPFQGRDMQPR